MTQVSSEFISVAIPFATDYSGRCTFGFFSLEKKRRCRNLNQRTSCSEEDDLPSEPLLSCGQYCEGMVPEINADEIW